MSHSDHTDTPHRRFNQLTGDWVLVSPHRTQRPWQGHEQPATASRPEHDPECYLCPGNERAGGIVNPNYKDVFVFDNDFPALLDAAGAAATDGLLVREPVTGCCRVICYSPRHDLALADMDTGQIERVVGAWCEQSRELTERYRWVQIFENRGALMGASSPHPHGQIWAVDALPTEAAKENHRQATYQRDHDSCLLIDYLNQELDSGERVICHNDHWVALVPYWAVWPFESIILPRRHVARLHDLNGAHRVTLAAHLKDLLQKYDRLFTAPMSYSVGWHSAPADAGAEHHWQLHAHVYPPALRSATIPKFMVGFELLAEKQRDITPEVAAERLRSL